MPRDTNNPNFGVAGGESDPLGGLLADIRPLVEPMSPERTQQIFHDALRQSGVVPKKSRFSGMRLWFAISLPASALAGAAVLAILAHKSPDSNANIKAADKYVHVDKLHPGSGSQPAPRHSKDSEPQTVPRVINAPRIVRKEPNAPVVKHRKRPQLARSVRKPAALMLARLEFVRNDVLASNVSAQPTADTFYVINDTQSVRSENAVLQYYTLNNTTQAEPVQVVVRLTKGNTRGFAKASTAILDDAGQMQRKYCTVKDDREAQNVTATTMIGDRSSGEGRLALTVRFTLDRPGKGEIKQ